MIQSANQLINRTKASATFHWLGMLHYFTSPCVFPVAVSAKLMHIFRAINSHFMFLWPVFRFSDLQFKLSMWCPVSELWNYNWTGWGVQLHKKTNDSCGS